MTFHGRSWFSFGWQIFAEREASFINQVERWIAAEGEVFAILRFSHSSGRREYAFFTSGKTFRSLMWEIPTATDVIVFRQRQLPFRGVVNEEFIFHALDNIPDKATYLVVHVDPILSTPLLNGWIGDSHIDLFEELAECLGDTVAIGLEPAWYEEDNQNMISHRKDGVIGVY